MRPIENGSIWQDADPRMGGRRVRVVGVKGHSSYTLVSYRNVATNRLAVSREALFLKAFRQVASAISYVNENTRNWCSQCGTPLVDADWNPSAACGPGHAVVAAELSQTIRASLRAETGQEGK